MFTHAEADAHKHKHTRQVVLAAFPAVIAAAGRTEREREERCARFQEVPALRHAGETENEIGIREGVKTMTKVCSANKRGENDGGSKHFFIS